MFTFIIPFALAAIILACTISERSYAAKVAARKKALAEQQQARRDAEFAAAKAAAKAPAAVNQPKRPRGRPRKEKQPVNPPAAPANPPAAQSSNPPAAKSNGAFANQRVAFTGRLPGMTRKEAIAAVQANGGKAYETMPVGTTLLVVGDNPGMGKMDKADEWIGQVKKITAAQFFKMLAA